MSVQGIHQELTKAGLKQTKSRLAVLELLQKAEKPVDVNSMIDYLSSNHIKSDPATVFRMVNTFTEKGITKQVQLNEGKFRYELSSKDEHHHLVCEQCGEIDDISDCNIEALEKEINDKKGFLVKRHSLEFFGLCKTCQS